MNPNTFSVELRKKIKTNVSTDTRIVILILFFLSTNTSKIIPYPVSYISKRAVHTIREHYCIFEQKSIQKISAYVTK